MKSFNSLSVILLVVSACCLTAAQTPQPSTYCTIDNDCTNADHTISVTPTAAGSCLCTCKNNWTNTECQECPKQYDMANNCYGCAEGTTGTYPDCFWINCGQANCSFHADSIVAPCKCNCRNNWTLADCSQCPEGWDPEQDCASCAPGYDGWPNCAAKCTISGNCSGHASAVTGNAITGCKCTCSNQWNGTDCSSCASEYRQSDCADCATGYGGYPNCKPTCDLGRDCHYHAISVSGSPDTQCDCICRNSWTGTSCDVCPGHISAGGDCAMCETGYVDFPNCVQGCTIAGNCSNHASGVTGSIVEGCNCTCRNQWNGSTCDDCPSGIDTGSDCGACKTGYGNFPNCVPTCFTSVNCHDHASSVSGTPPLCECICRNNWMGTGCDTCPTGYSSTSDCANCASGYGGGSCSPACTSTTDCNGRASTVSGYRPACSCTCRNKWEGSKCTVCPSPFSGADCSGCISGYNGYPYCSPACTMDNCSTGAGSVSGNTRIGCTCTCRNQWFGPACNMCPWNYDSTSDCASCASGLVGSGCTVPCTSMGNCSDHAGSVAQDSTCTCACRNKWYGSQCQFCSSIYDKDQDCGKCATGYDYFPTCGRLCVNSTDCLNRATAVNGTVATGCECTCRNEWYGTKCAYCPPYTDVTKDCGTCVAGASGYPSCQRLCTEVQDCHNRATSVSGVVPSSEGCDCTCRSNWYGTSCQACPAKFNPSLDCAQCQVGYGGTYPDCIPLCTNTADCNNRASEVNGVKGNCSCTCKYQWEGLQCQTCPTGFSTSSNCNACASGYAGMPNCSPLCAQSDCYNHAVNVSGTQYSGCVCTCKNKWALDNCSSCPYGFDPLKDCGACAQGFTGWPTCTRACILSQDCTPNAVSVSGDYASGCVCACRNSWTGTTCGICPAGYGGTDCASCATGYEGYPQCVLKCTFANCTGHATAVHGNEATGCTCECRNKWTGNKCDYCPPRLSATLDCAACANVSYTNFPLCDWTCADTWCSNSTWEKWGNDTYGCFCRPPYSGGGGPHPCCCAVGYYDYPVCKRDRNCSALLDCNNHTEFVNGTTRTGCNCTCRNYWKGEQCQECAAEYDYDTDCKACANGYQGIPPNCYKMCNTLQNCSGRASSVTGNSNTGCNCTCINAYIGAKCDICRPGADPSTSCSSCLPGHENYPNCWLKCTTAANCSGNANSVTGNTGSTCKCVCKNNWYTDYCDKCPPGYDASASGDCGKCAAGYNGYPACYPECTTANCSEHSTTVTGNWNLGCKCACRNEWDGEYCETCHTGFNASDDCGSCVDDYFGYPNCVRRCSLATDCSGNAHNVTGNGTVGCQCDCRNQWSGQKCDNCWIQYDKAKDCGSCASGYSGAFPDCYSNCENGNNCNGHATNVTGNTNTGCNCTCRHLWFDSACSNCPVGVNKTDDCNSCEDGFGGWPNCARLCNMTTDCNGHADSVTGTVGTSTGDNCTCKCRNQWTGGKCDICGAKFDPAKDCGACHPNYEGTYPDCKLKCTKVSNCNNNAVSVSGNVPDGCVCNCLNQWKSDNCGSCPPEFNASLGCATCANGRTDYPYCYQACLSANCSNHEASVTGNENTQCSCTCRNHWSGKICDECPQGYNASDDCSSCAVGYTGYPNCSRQCTVALDCSLFTHAINVNGTTYSGCQCDCRNAWTGQQCETCPRGTNAAANCATCMTGYEGYPVCDLVCTIQNNCSSHASQVWGTTKTGCNCTCQNAWSGKDCSICPEGADLSASCGLCEPGFTGYPKCTRECTLADCSNHATAVSGDTYHGCDCTCRNEWTNKTCGLCKAQFEPLADCGSCSPGYSGYPNCVRPCRTVDDCTGHADSVTGIAPNCTCTCRNEWANSTCGHCPFPYAGGDCQSCVAGYTNYPVCNRMCTNQDNCTSHASKVEGLMISTCKCTCRNQWTNDNCAVCPPRYDIRLDCSGCSPEYDGAYPDCYLKCTPTFNCSDHADVVTGNSRVGCYCKCRNKWNGTTCSTCPDVFSGADCDKCAANYTGYPNCTLITPEPTTTLEPTTTIEPTTTPAPTNSTPAPTNATTTEAPTTTAATTTTEVPTTTSVPVTSTTEVPSTTTMMPTATTTTEVPTTTSVPVTSTTEVPSTTTMMPTTTLPPTTTILPTSAEPTTTESVVTTPASTNATTTEAPTTTAEPTTIAPSTTVSPTPEPSTTSVPTTTILPTTSKPTNTSEAPTSAAPTTLEPSTTTLEPSTTTPEPTTTLQPTTNVPNTTTETPPTTLPPITVQPTVPTACTVEKDCSSHASGVQLANNSCECTCRQQWAGDECQTCPVNFDPFIDCGGCAEGYEPYPKCLCAYHVTGTIGLTTSANVDMTNEAERITFLKAATEDINTFLAQSCHHHGVTSKQGYIYKYDVETMASGDKKVSLSVDAALSDMNCEDAKLAAECMEQQFLNCLNFTQVAKHLGDVDVAALHCSQNIVMTRTNPCGNLTCAAAADGLLAAAPYTLEGKPWWPWLLLALAVLALILLAIAYKKGVYRQFGKRAFADPTKYTKKFAVEQIAEDELANTSNFIYNEERAYYDTEVENAPTEMGSTFADMTLTGTNGSKAAATTSGGGETEAVPPRPIQEEFDHAPGDGVCYDDL